MSPGPLLVVCMGVSGCGKTTVARAIANATGLAFFEADDFHSAENRARMSAGMPLDDAMREPWIKNICAALLAEQTAGRDCVLACSALRRAHRDRFRELGFTTRFLFLGSNRELVARWVAQREGHFMPKELLDSQYEALESPVDEADVITIKMTADWSGVVDESIRLVQKDLNARDSSSRPERKMT